MGKRYVRASDGWWHDSGTPIILGQPIDSRTAGIYTNRSSRPSCRGGATAQDTSIVQRIEVGSLSTVLARKGVGPLVASNVSSSATFMCFHPMRSRGRALDEAPTNSPA